MSLKEQVIEQIKTVYDPEIPVNIYELGLIYEVEITDSGLAKIRMTLTTPMCPVADSLPAWGSHRGRRLATHGSPIRRLELSDLG